RTGLHGRAGHQLRGGPAGPARHAGRPGRRASGHRRGEPAHRARAAGRPAGRAARGRTLNVDRVVSRSRSGLPREASAVIPALTSALHGLPLPGLALPGLLMLAAITLTGMLIALLAHSARVAATVTAIPQGRRAAALREKSWRAG